MTRHLPHLEEGPELGTLDAYWVNVLRRQWADSAAAAYAAGREARAAGDHNLALAHDQYARGCQNAAQDITRVGAQYAETPEETP